MANIMKALEGKKTYIVMAVTAIMGGIDALNQAGLIHFVVPAFVYVVLATLGVYTRAVAK